MSSCCFLLASDADLRQSHYLRLMIALKTALHAYCPPDWSKTVSRSLVINLAFFNKSYTMKLRVLLRIDF